MERLQALLNCATESEWRDAFFLHCRRQGFDQVLFAIVPSRHAALESAFVHSSYASRWRETYDAEKLHYVDPTVEHCLVRNVPVVWSSAVFRSPCQKRLYEEASAYGIRSGISYPIHGPRGEFGVLSFACGKLGAGEFMDEFGHTLSNLALIRDYAFESCLRFALPARPAEREVHITPRERECLMWSMEGKSSWEIARILCCSEATVNFHVANIRRKFDVSTRRQAVVKAIQLGLISAG
jgi:LuxR family transcriptional regulator, quorum-sensing system regulator LasR